MSTAANKNRRGARRAHDNDADPNGSEDLNEGNDPKDANPLSIQDQISELSATLVEHSQALDALKQVPNILANLSQSLGLSNEPADEFHGEQQNELYSDPQFQSDDENELLAKFNEKDTEGDETGESSIDNMETEMLDILNVSQPSSEYGEALHDEVAKSFARMVANHPSKEKVEKWKDLFKPPDNCKTLGVPRVNPEIWPQLKTRARHNDLSLQQHGSYVSQASVAVSKIANLVFSAGRNVPKEFSQEILKLSMDAGSILGLASQELSVKRKTELRPCLNKDFVAICSAKVPTTEWLFGDNIVDQLKASKSAANVVRPAFTPFVRPNRMHPYKQPNLNYRRPSFQPRGGSNQNRQPRMNQPRQFPPPANLLPQRKLN